KADRRAIVQQIRLEAALELSRPLRLQLRVSDRLEQVGVDVSPVDPPGCSQAVQPEMIRRLRLTPGMAVGRPQSERADDGPETFGEEGLIRDEVGDAQLRERRQLHSPTERAPPVQPQPAGNPEALVTDPGLDEPTVGGLLGTPFLD